MDRQNTISRRQALAGIGLAGATAAVPITGASVAKAATADRSAWNKAVAWLKATEAEYSRVHARYSEAHDAAEAACPRRDEFFSRYGLGCGLSRERNFRAAHITIVNERVDERRRRLSSEEAKQATADGYRVVDDFETWLACRDEAFREHDAWESRFDAVVDKRATAQEPC